MTKIIGFSGRKQSGKNTSAHFVYGLYLAGTGRFKDVGISNNGQIEVLKTDNTLVIFEPQKYYLGVGDIDPEVMDAVNQLSDTVKIYSFADPLKSDICMRILGLSYEQCYGTDEQKNATTHLRWEDMPGVTCIPDEQWISIYDSNYDDNRINDTCQQLGLHYHKSGFMSGREVMEYVGTHLFRRMVNSCWANATLSTIKKESPAVALICDTRFPNEVDAVSDNSGIVIRLTRDPLQSQSDPERALDRDRFDWSKFNYVIDNANMTIAEQADALYPIILQEVTENANS